MSIRKRSSWIRRCSSSIEEQLGKRSYELLLPLAMLPLACSSSSSETLGSTSSEIAGGVRDTGHPNVVLLLSWDSSNAVGSLGSCTAEVVAPDVLLTAAHCFDSDRENYAVYLGDDGTDLGTPVDPSKAAVRAQLHMAKDVHPHPQRVVGDWGYYDIGVVILQNDLTGVPPLPIHRMPPSGPNLSNLTIVGYGKTYDRDTTFAITKHKADGLSATLDPADTMTVGDARQHACVGDSGGPALAQINGVSTIIGINSYSDETGDATRCRIASHYQRVDKYLAFIDQYVPLGGAGGAGGTGGAGGAGATGGSTGTGGAGGLGGAAGSAGSIGTGGAGGAVGSNSGGTTGAGGWGAGSGGTWGAGGTVGTGGTVGGAGGWMGGGAPGLGGAAGLGGGIGGSECRSDPDEDGGCTLATQQSKTSARDVFGVAFLAASLAWRRRARRSGQDR